MSEIPHEQPREYFERFCWEHHIQPKELRTFMFDMLDIFYEESETDIVERARMIGRIMVELGVSGALPDTPRTTQTPS